MGEAAQTKDAPADLINVAIEELVRQRFERPAFDTMNRVAHRVRTFTQRGFYQRVFERLDAVALSAIAALFVVDPSMQRSPWERVKADAGSPTLAHLRERIEQLSWLEMQPGSATLLAGIPDVKPRCSSSR